MSRSGDAEMTMPRFGGSNRELTTVLAALRAWQQTLIAIGPACRQLSGTGHFVSYTPLSAEEIDTLCAWLNEED